MLQMMVIMEIDDDMCVTQFITSGGSSMTIVETCGKGI